MPGRVRPMGGEAREIMTHAAAADDRAAAPTLATRARDVALGLLIWTAAIAPGVLPALAHAAPPDPTWVAGIYDDGDLDDVVALIASGSADLTESRPATIRPAAPSADSPAREVDAPRSAVTPAPAHSRAPPFRVVAASFDPIDHAEGERPC